MLFELKDTAKTLLIENVFIIVKSCDKKLINRRPIRDICQLAVNGVAEIYRIQLGSNHNSVRSCTDLKEVIRKDKKLIVYAMAHFGYRMQICLFLSEAGLTLN